MELEKGKISDSQLIFSIGCFIQGSTLLSAFVISVSKQDTWFVVLTGFIASLGVMGIYIALMKRYPYKNILQMFEAIFGVFAGKIISTLYFFYFLSLAALNSRDVGNFVLGYILPDTPMIAVLAMFMFVCSWVVRSGIENLVRYSFWYVLVSFIVIFLIYVLLIKDMKFSNLLPAFTLPPVKYVQGTHIVAAIPFCEIVVFLMMVPSLREQDKAARSFLLGLLIGGVTLLAIVIRDVATLGNLIGIVALPSYEAVKLIDIADILTRMEVLYAIELLFLQFFKVSVLFYATVLAMAHVLGLRSYKPYVLTTGIIIASLSIIVFRSPMENAQWGPTVAPFYNTIFQLLFPGIALLTSLLRGLFKKNKAVEA